MFLRGIGFGFNSQLWFFITVLVFVSTVTFFEIKITRLESDRENLGKYFKVFLKILIGEY